MDLTSAPSCGCLARTVSKPSTWGLSPLRVERPVEAKHAAAALAAAQAAGEETWITGTSSRLGAAPPVPAAAVVIETAGLAGIVAYERDDQTLTVRAGTRLEEVHALLAEEGLELAGAHFGLADGTVGGLVATDLADARRGRVGALRDRILGMTVATADGRVTKSGGRVVKNVAGYDLMRLHAGAHGAFGFITEVTLRLSPRPEAHAPFERAFDDARRAADEAWRIAREAPALGLVAWTARPGEPALVAWVHEGDREQVEDGARWSAAAHGEPHPGDAPDHQAPVTARLRMNALEHVCPERTNLLVRASLLPSRIPALAHRLEGLGLPFLGAFAMQGAAFARIDRASVDGAATVGAVTRAIEDLGGAWRIQGAWTAADGPAWGGFAVPHDLYARLKAVFDPAGVLGPALFRGAGEGAR